MVFVAEKKKKKRRMYSIERNVEVSVLCGHRMTSSSSSVPKDPASTASAEYSKCPRKISLWEEISMFVCMIAK